MNGARFHLAWFKLNTDFFLSGRPTSEVLQYALVPEELPERGAWHLDRVDLTAMDACWQALGLRKDSQPASDCYEQAKALPVALLSPEGARPQ